MTPTNNKGINNSGCIIEEAYQFALEDKNTLFLISL
jgi:hypothetical protein